MRSLGGGSNRYASHIDLSGARAHKISISGPETSKTGRKKSLFMENYKPTDVAVWSRPILTKLAYLVEKMGDVGGKRTIIDPCQHKAVRISVRQALLNHASVHGETKV